MQQSTLLFYNPTSSVIQVTYDNQILLSYLKPMVLQLYSSNINLILLWIEQKKFYLFMAKYQLCSSYIGPFELCLQRLLVLNHLEMFICSLLFSFTFLLVYDVCHFPYV